MNSTIQIDSLSIENIAQATLLAHKIFPYDAVILDDNPGIAFRASLDPVRFQHLYKRDRLKLLLYYVVVNAHHKVIGTTGLYSHTDEASDVVWLGWFCLDESYRGKGIGRYVLDWTMSEAIRLQFKSLRLYTSDDPEFEVARALYEKVGFVRVGSRIRYDESEVIYEKKLE